MRGKIAVLSVVGLLGSAAYAQAQSPAGRFDGTYQPVSSKKVSDTYVTSKGMTGACPDRTPGQLTIQNNRVEYVSESGRHFAGTVNPQGQLLIKGIEQANIDGNPFRMNVDGMVDGSGTAHVRQLGNSCSYDFTFQKR